MSRRERGASAVLVLGFAFSCALVLRDDRASVLSGVCAAVAIVLYLVAQIERRRTDVWSEQARRAAIVEGTSDAIIGETLDGVITDWNRAAEQLFGHSADAALGRLAAELILPAERADEDARIRDRIARGEAVPAFDTTRLRADGTLIDVSVAASPIIGPDGVRAGFSKLVRDIGERKRAEAKIQALNASLEAEISSRTRLLSEARRDLQSILDAVPSLIGYWDRDLRNRFANQAHQTWFGWDPSAQPSRDLRQLLGERFEESQPHVEAALRGEALTTQLRFQHPNVAGDRFALAQYQPDIVDGQVRGFYVFARDITQEVKSNAMLAAALREKEGLLGAIREYATVSVTDCAGRMLEVNERLCETSGYRREELLGRDHRMLSSGLMEPNFWAQMWSTIAAGKPWRGEICNRAKDGSLSWHDSMIAALLDEHGRTEKYVSIGFDITATKRAERALLDSRAFLDRAGQVARVGAWELDVATQRITWSTEMYRIHELEPNSVVDLAAAIRFYPLEDRDSVERTVRAAIEHKQGWDFELPFTTANGRRLWIRSVGEVECNGDVPVRLVGTMQDLTARRDVELARQRIEAELQRTHERTAMAADAAGIGVWEFDVRANSLVWDDWMYRLYGQPTASTAQPYALWSQSLHPEDREAAELRLNAALAGEGEFDNEFRIVRPDGQVRHIKAAARVVRDEHGVPLRMTGVNFDITERKRAELELRETSSLLETVLESASDVSLIATDPNLLIRVFNTGAERLLGYSASEVVNRTTPILIHDPAQVAAVAAELTMLSGKLVQGGAAFIHPLALGRPREWTYIRKDGSRVTVSLTVTAMRDANGAVFGYLGVAHDVTRQKEYEQTLREAKRKAEQASVAKGEFLANMSHEIRTPMNAVLGLSYLLSQTALNPEQAAFVGQISTSGNSLLALINDILDFSKIEAGELRVESAPFSLSALLQRVYAATALQAKNKGICFEVSAFDLPEQVEGDVTRLEQILTNLLSNAIKFTARGGVTLRVRSLSGETSVARLYFEVEDTGIGIPEADQVRLFTPFAQADASTTRRFGGTGLGLSIVKRLTELMGGRVSLRSSPGLGSTFRVDLEFAVPSSVSLENEQTSLQPANEKPLQGMRILIVDDSEINLSVARHVLEHHGASVAAAVNGEQAVERVAAQPDEFDAVLMDVQMPVMDGYEAARRIRRLGHLQLRIIALTADARTSERARSLAAGMDDFVSKPFDPAGLVRCLLRRVGGRAASGVRRSVPPVPEIAALSSSWPTVPGLEISAARQRFCGDWHFFRALLCRFFVDFSYLTRLDEIMPSAPLTEYADRMHKVRGSAGQMGALEIQRLAAQLESACSSRDRGAAEQAAKRLAASFRSLRRAARATTQLALPPALWRSEQEAVAAADLTRVAELLRAQDASVLVEIEAVAPGLQKALGEESYRTFVGLIERLRFQDAAIALERGERRAS